MSVSTIPRMRTGTATPLMAPQATGGHACPRCDTMPEAKRRILELETQVRILTEKATAAVDKLADYEDQLQRLKTSQSPISPSDLTSTPVEAALNEPVTTPPVETKLQSRFSNLLSRRSIAHLSTVSSRSEADLQIALQREQDLRQKAEGKLTQMNTEIEDLSVQLFQQANEMVATERKARAKLEERVEMLEKRDDDKRKRLDRLEGAMKRIDRVRDLLAP
ncbi:hypothetical protein EJ05DRAFT_495541 [Pseudovirgaria hyperparasitica]|uniref:GDP/GTP exchange factor Sec2 N-terminal domain-containing protein n=1 Tax=Pseudovirgaria hyperparasitica TaxID=470096 RepID=A0A6A6WKI5_9PEZI|nr:uncharacterized protein EJ05DRAFT_495541 [Pseudovirgaria hyperparasitica]KAF2762672.1 hypothetical protein EJ05DRAFT_495541 [Pseudovirgaria hyperparasitica]